MTETTPGAPGFSGKDITPEPTQVPAEPTSLNNRTGSADSPFKRPAGNVPPAGLQEHQTRESSLALSRVLPRVQARVSGMQPKPPPAGKLQTRVESVTERPGSTDTVVEPGTNSRQSLETVNLKPQLKDAGEDRDLPATPTRGNLRVDDTTVADPGASDMGSGGSRVDGTDRELNEPFDSSGCIRRSLRDFQSDIRGESIFGFPPHIYIDPDDLVTRQDGFNLTSRSFERDKVKTIDELADPDKPLTVERVEQLSDEGNQAVREFGQLVADRARPLGLTEDLTQEELNAELSRTYKAGQVPFTFNGQTQDKNWSVVDRVRYSFGTHYDKLLIVNNDQPGANAPYSVVSLNALAERDQAFLSEKIVNVQNSLAAVEMAKYAFNDLALHQFKGREAEFLPPFITELLKIQDKEQLEGELGDILKFLAWRRALPSTDFSENSSFIDNLSIQLPVDFPIVSYQYAEHMAECPSASQETRNKNTYISQIYTLLDETESHNEEANLGPVIQGVFSDPYAYAVRQDRLEEMGIEPNFYARFTNFVTETIDIYDREALLEKLQVSMQKAYETFIKFKKAFDASARGAELEDVVGFDQLIQRVTLHAALEIEKVGMHAYVENGNISDITEILETTSKEFFRRTEPKKKWQPQKQQPMRHLPGTTIEEEGISFHNPQLEAILVLLIIKNMYTKTSKNAESKTGDDYREANREALSVKRNSKILAQELAKRHERKSHLFNQFKEKTGITDEEIAAISQETSLPGEIHDRSFGARLLALVMQKKGLLTNINADSFQAFMNEMFPVEEVSVFDALGGFNIN